MPLMQAQRPSSAPAIAVGGGLAGAAFALELARHGREVILLERTRGPHHKVCGEFVSEDTQAALARLHIDVQSLGAVPVSRFRLASGERQAITKLPFSAVGLSRMRLDETLLAAAERAGAGVVRGVAVAEIEPRNGEVSVRAANRKWRGSVAALATGKHGLRAFPRTIGKMVGFKLHLESSAAASNIADTVQLVFFRGGYAGACLVEGGVLSVAWVMHRSLVQSIGASWAAQSEYLARQSSLIGGLLAKARPLLAKPVAVANIPYGFLRAANITPQIFPVGDQLAVVPSFTGDGMAIALNSGILAARAVLENQSSAIYQRNVVEYLKPQFRLARGIGAVLETPATCAMSIMAGQIVPSLMRSIASATRAKFHGLPPIGIKGQ